MSLSHDHQQQTRINELEAQLREAQTEIAETRAQVRSHSERLTDAQGQVAGLARVGQELENHRRCLTSSAVYFHCEEWMAAWSEFVHILADLPAASKAILAAAEREPGLKEALRKYGVHASVCLAHGWKRGDNEYRSGG